MIDKSFGNTPKAFKADASTPQNPEGFRQRLETIWNRPLTIETIEQFGDTAVNDLIALTEDVLTYSLGESRGADTETEDKAFAVVALPPIDEVLVKVEEVQQLISNIKSQISHKIPDVNVVITPPDATELVLSKGMSGNSFEDARIFPRLLTLLYILERDFGLNHADVSMVRGITTEKMMREEPYVRVLVHELDRVIYVCDEEGNASYVFDTQNLSHLDISIDQVDTMTKKERKTLIEIAPTVGVRVVQNPEWREQISDYLSNDVSEQEQMKRQADKPKITSEFEPKRSPAWLAFQALVQTEWSKLPDPKPKNVQVWYSSVYKQNGWPSTPHITYKSKGWTSEPELVGLPKPEDFPVWEDFQKSVQLEWSKLPDPKPKNVQVWYSSVYKQNGWPGNPLRTYQGKGWTSWPELVGLPKPEDFPVWEDFQKSVQLEWNKLPEPASSVRAWYSSVCKQKRWPVAPYETYKGKGWTSWPELVGKTK
jgi:hypothetical protein